MPEATVPDAIMHQSIPAVSPVAFFLIVCPRGLALDYPRAFDNLEIFISLINFIQGSQSRERILTGALQRKKKRLI